MLIANNMLIADKQTENACQTRTHRKHVTTLLRTFTINNSIRQSLKWHQLTMCDMQKQYTQMDFLKVI